MGTANDLNQEGTLSSLVFRGVIGKRKPDKSKCQVNTESQGRAQDFKPLPPFFFHKKMIDKERGEANLKAKETFRTLGE